MKLLFSNILKDSNKNDNEASANFKVEIKQRLGKLRQKITKEDIGSPTNFRHVQHIGWDATYGFDLVNVSRDLAKFFGVDGSHSGKEQVKSFFYKPIDEDCAKNQQ